MDLPYYECKEVVQLKIKNIYCNNRFHEPTHNRSYDIASQNFNHKFNKGELHD